MAREKREERGQSVGHTLVGDISSACVCVVEDQMYTCTLQEFCSLLNTLKSMD